MQAHWRELGRSMESNVGELPDDRLIDLYKKLISEGWTESPPMPLSSRNADQQVKNLVMHAVSEELLAREGRKFDKMNRPGSSARRLADAYGRRG